MRCVCAVSSLHPIDLSALVTTHAYTALTPTDEVLVTIVDDSEVPTNPHLRVLAPQLSLPLPSLTLDSKGIYRQLFIPLHKPHHPANWPRLAVAASAVIGSLDGLAHQTDIEAQRRRLHTLIASGRQHIGDCPTAAETLTFFAKHVLEAVLPARINTIPYKQMIFGEHGQAAAYGAIAQTVCGLAIGHSPVEFDKGGYVEFLDGDGNGFECRKVSLDAAGVRLHSDSQPVVLEIRGTSVRLLISETVKPVGVGAYIRLRGPLELSLHAQYGNVVHLPWYCRQISEGAVAGDICVSETISPITCASRMRTSRWAGGEGYRLDPSGYSLLDYHNPEVLNLVSRIARIRITSLDELPDWHHLLANYSVAHQKALKYQGGTSQYCARRLYDLRESLKKGSVDPLVLLRACATARETPCSECGRILLSAVGVLRYLHEWERRAPGVVLSDEQSFLLRNLGLIGTDGHPRTSAMLDAFSDLFMSSANWRSDIVRQRPELDGIGSEDLTPVKEALSVLPARQCNSLPARDRPLDLRQVARVLLDEAESYYQCVLALCASSLKANLWNCWLVMGPQGYVYTARDLWRRRLCGPIQLSARLWSSSDVAAVQVL